MQLERTPASQPTLRVFILRNQQRAACCPVSIVCPKDTSPGHSMTVSILQQLRQAYTVHPQMLLHTQTKQVSKAVGGAAHSRLNC